MSLLLVSVVSIRCDPTDPKTIYVTVNGPMGGRVYLPGSCTRSIVVVAPSQAGQNTEFSFDCGSSTDVFTYVSDLIVQ